LKIWTKSALIVLASLYATAAQSLVVFTNANIGRTATVTYIGSVNGSPTNKIGATTIYTLKSISQDQKSWVFEYTITNTSSVASRLRSFGFDVTNSAGAAITQRSATGVYATSGSGDNFPEGFGTVNTCFRATGGSNCTGGPNGLTKGLSATGLFTLSFASKPVSLTLDRFVTRFQSISPKVNNGDSGIGKQLTLIKTDPGGVPEPAQWLLLIGGFGITGATLRRRKAVLA